MSEWTYWEYDPQCDYELVRLWAEARRGMAPHPDWLPEAGFVLCRQIPLIICFLYHDPSCRVAFIDHVHTRPETSLTLLKQGIVFAMNDPIQKFSALRGVHTILTRSPAAMARTMLHTPRWYVKDKELMSMVYFYTPEEVEVA